MEYTPLDYNGFEQYLIKESTHKYWGGFQYEFAFDNGYGAKVIKHDESFGNVDDLFELEILKNNELVEVIGWLTNKRVINILNKLNKKE